MLLSVFHFKDGLKIEADDKSYVTDNGFNHLNLEKAGDLLISKVDTTVSYLGKVKTTKKTENDQSARGELDDVKARSERIQNFHAAANKATTMELGNNDKDIESILTEVTGTSVLVKLQCSEIVGFPAVTTDLKISGLIDVALSIEGEANPKISFFVVKGVVDVSLFEYFSMMERSCCCVCCNYSIGDVSLDYQQSRNATSQFSTLPIEGTVIDATCYSNEDISFKTKSRTRDLPITVTDCCFSCFGCCMFCANCKCCDCFTCCDCIPIMDKISNYQVLFRAKDSRLIGVHPDGPKIGTADVVEHGIRFDVTKSFEKAVFVVFYYRSPLDNKTHKCTMKLNNGDFLNAKRFVNLLGKYRSKCQTQLLEHNAIEVNPVGQLSNGTNVGSPTNWRNYFESLIISIRVRLNK